MAYSFRGRTVTTPDVSTLATNVMLSKFFEELHKNMSMAANGLQLLSALYNVSEDTKVSTKSLGQTCGILLQLGVMSEQAALVLFQYMRSVDSGTPVSTDELDKLLLRMNLTAYEQLMEIEGKYPGIIPANQVASMKEVIEKGRKEGKF